MLTFVCVSLCTRQHGAVMMTTLNELCTVYGLCILLNILYTVYVNKTGVVD